MPVANSFLVVDKNGGANEGDEFVVVGSDDMGVIDNISRLNEQMNDDVVIWIDDDYECVTSCISEIVANSNPLCYT